jgi:hypothetical protein
LSSSPLVFLGALDMAPISSKLMCDYRYHIGESMLPSMRKFLRYIDLEEIFIAREFYKKVWWFLWRIIRDLKSAPAPPRQALHSVCIHQNLRDVRVILLLSVPDVNQSRYKFCYPG